MESHLHRQYRITLWKYRKFRQRLDKRIKNNTLSGLSLRHRNRLLRTIERLRRRLASLEQILKHATAGALTAAAISLSTPALAQQPVPQGIEFQVNTFEYYPAVAADANGNFVVVSVDKGQLYNAAGVAQGSELEVANGNTATSIAMDADGDFVVVWSSYDGSDEGVYAQRYNAAGEAQGSEFLVNAYTTSSQRKPSVAMDADGDFVIVWQSFGQDGSMYGIFGQRFNAAGEIQGLEFQVNTFTDGYQDDPQVAMDADGDFVVVWTSNGQDGDDLGVYAQRFNASGDPQGGEFKVNSYTTNYQASPSVAMDEDGNFVISWNSYQDDSYSNIYAQRYDAAGVAQGDEFLINSFTTDYQNEPSVSMDADGDFVIVWFSYNQDGSDASIFGQYFNASGDPAGDEFPVNSNTTGYQSYPVVAMDDAGDFVVAWGHFPDEYSSEVYARLYSVAPPPTPFGEEFQVNTYTTSDQSSSAIAMDADGNFVVVWISDGQDGDDLGVYAQRFDALGEAQGSEFLVNTFTTNDQSSPSIAMDADGDFVIAWQSFGQDNNLYGLNGIYAQRYNASGTVQGIEFLVNTHIPNSQSSPSIAMDADGDFVISWRSTEQDGSTYGIFAQRYNASGAAQGSEFQVNTYTTNSQSSSSIAMDADGDFVIAWSSFGQDGNGSGIYARRYDAAGVAQGDEFKVNTYTTQQQFSPSIARGADGDFVIAWASSGQDGSIDGIYAQRYNALGEVQGSEFQINTYTASDQFSPSVSTDAAGNFVIAWQSRDQDGDNLGIYAQRYNALGEPQYSEFKVNTYTADSQSSPSIAMDSDGNFVITWESAGQDGNDSGIYAKGYQTGQAPVLAINADLTLDEGDNSLINSALLNTSDADNTNAEIIYEVTALPANGTLTNNSVVLALNDTFTQEDINNNLVAYEHNGSETTGDSFDFTVSDGTAALPEETFAITVNPVNDAPVLQTNAGLTLDEGASSLITSALLNTSDVDNTNAEIIYEVTALPANGTLSNNSTALALNDTFTQEDVNNNLVAYEHDGGETTGDSFGFTVNDGTAALPEETFTITVNPVEDALLDQSITFNPIADVVNGAAPFELSAVATSGLPVQFEIVSGPAALSGNTVTITGAGTITIAASQAGDDDYNPATTAEQSFCSNPAKPTITVQGENTESPTLVSSATAGNQWFKGTEPLTGETGNTLVVDEFGIYRVQVTIDGCVSEISSDAALVITGDADTLQEKVIPYPNPVTDMLHIGGISTPVVRVVATDAAGKAIEMNFQQQADVVRVPVSNLAVGNYILRIAEREKLHQVKFVKK